MRRKIFSFVQSKFSILLCIAALLTLLSYANVTAFAAFVTTPQIAAGAYHNLALRWDDTVWAWGSNQYGQL